MGRFLANAASGSFGSEPRRSNHHKHDGSVRNCLKDGFSIVYSTSDGVDIEKNVLSAEDFCQVLINVAADVLGVVTTIGNKDFAHNKPFCRDMTGAALTTDRSRSGDVSTVRRCCALIKYCQLLYKCV